MGKFTSHTFYNEGEKLFVSAQYFTTRTIYDTQFIFCFDLWRVVYLRYMGSVVKLPRGFRHTDSLTNALCLSNLPVLYSSSEWTWRCSILDDFTISSPPSPKKKDWRNGWIYLFVLHGVCCRHNAPAHMFAATNWLFTTKLSDDVKVWTKIVVWEHILSQAILREKASKNSGSQVGEQN